jgi:hypothetical protein
MKTYLKKLLVISSLLVMNSGLAIAADSTQLAAFKKAIRVQYDLKEQAWKAGDAESIVTKFYTKDAISFMEGEPETTIGQDEFRKVYQQLVKDVPSVRMETVHAYVNGNMGWDFANFYAVVRPEVADKYPKGPVRILFLWEKIKGKWVCKGDAVVLGEFKK